MTIPLSMAHSESAPFVMAGILSRVDDDPVLGSQSPYTHKTIASRRLLFKETSQDSAPLTDGQDEVEMSTASIRRALLHRSTILSTCLATLLVYAFLTGPSITSLTSTSTLSLDELTSALKSTTDKLTPSPPATSTPSTIAAGDAAALRDLCSRTTWRPNLALHCTSRCGPDRSSICGGLNNARDRLQTCARLAVDAGAGTLVVPSIAARSELALYAVDPAQVEGAGEPVVLCADEWFSVERLRGVLGGACPQMRVEVACPGEGIGGGNGFKGVAGLVGADADDVVEMPWRALGGERYGASAGQTFRQAVDEVLGLDRLQEMAKPVLVDYGDPYFACAFLPCDDVHLERMGYQPSKSPSESSLEMSERATFLLSKFTDKAKQGTTRLAARPTPYSKTSSGR